MLTPWKESYDQPRQPIKKQRRSFANKGPSSQAMVFPVVMYGCEIWTVKKAERQRVDAFGLCCWRRLLRVPWTARRSNQSIQKEISPGCSLKDLCWNRNSNPLATWCEEPTHWKRPWCWERLKARGEGDDRGWDGWMASPTQWTWIWVVSGSWWWTGRPGMLHLMGLQRVRHDWGTELTDLHEISNMDNTLLLAVWCFMSLSLPPLKTHFQTSFWFLLSISLKYGDGNGTILQYSYLEYSMDGVAW